jgi:hypothetical protein
MFTDKKLALPVVDAELLFLVLITSKAGESGHLTAVLRWLEVRHFETPH